MPSISLSSPGTPIPPTGPSPVAANPLVAIDGVALPAFANVIDGLAPSFTFDASLPLKPSVGKTLPPVRPDIAGGPEPLPLINVEAVMVGSTATPPLPPQGTAEPADGTNAADAGEDAAPALPGAKVETALPQPFDIAPEPTATPPKADAALPQQPIAAGLQDWRLGEASKLVLAQATARPAPPPVPVQLPPEEVADMPAVDPDALPEKAQKAQKDVPAEPAPAQVADASMLQPAPVAWVPVPPQPAAEPAAPAPDTDGAPAPAQPIVAGMPDKQPVPSPRSDQQLQQPAPAQPVQPTPPVAVPQPAHPTALPSSFTLPPDVAREIGRLVQAAVGERDEPRSSDASDPAPLPPVSQPLPQTAPTQSAPLHPAFAASHRPVVDTGRAEWMQAMIDRIAEMPQPEGGRRDAQIRLVPDALGPVEVKIEQRQDRLHVTLQAETTQARQLLSDAAPKLHELAEARGIRFAQAGFGSADSQDRRHAPDQQQPSTPLRPRSAAANAADVDPDSQTDGDLIA